VEEVKLESQLVVPVHFAAKILSNELHLTMLVARSFPQAAMVVRLVRKENLVFPNTMSTCS